MQCSIKSERCGGLCTGFDGSKIWKKIDEDVDKIDCGTCKDEGKKLISFAHDIVNARLGKPIFNKKNFDEYVKIIDCLRAKHEPQ